MEPARAAEACGAIHTGLCREYRTESGRVRTGAANWASSPENPLPATDSLMELVVERVKLRVRRGGHFIPEDVIRRRYERGIANLHLYQQAVDSWKLWDTSHGEPELIDES